MSRDFYEVLGVPRTASRDQVREAFKKIAVQCHPDRNKDEDAHRRLAEASEAYAVLSDNEKRHLYDILGPDKYDDPREVLFYRLNQEAANRETEREWDAKKSAVDTGTAESIAFIVFFLLILDFVIPSWVLGPWFYIINGFLILGVAIGVHDLAKS
jgi:curved DNA-binding protein CbpA